MTPRELHIIHLCKKFMYGKNFLYRAVANAVARSFEADKYSGPNLSVCIGKSLQFFPATVRPNRHHRRRFPVDKAPTLATKIEGEFRVARWSCRPAVITKLR